MLLAGAAASSLLLLLHLLLLLLLLRRRVCSAHARCMQACGLMLLLLHAAVWCGVYYSPAGAGAAPGLLPCCPGGSDLL
jgi:hypothetical protein